MYDRIICVLLLWSGRSSRQPRQTPSSGSVSVFNLITTVLICLAESRIEDGGRGQVCPPQQSHVTVINRPRPLTTWCGGKQLCLVPPYSARHPSRSLCASRQGLRAGRHPPSQLMILPRHPRLWCSLLTYTISSPFRSTFLIPHYAILKCSNN